MSQLIRKLKSGGFKETLRAVKINFFWWLEKQILFHAPKLLHYTFDGEQHLIAFRKPRFLYLELTNNCNLNCKMCIRYGNRPVSYMPYEFFTRLIDEAAEIGGLSLSFHFAGESTLHPQFKECLQYAIARKNRFYKLSLTTNGTRFTEDIAKVALGLDWVTFSVDGVGKTNEEIRVGSKYSEVKKNIETFLRLRGKRSTPIISTNTVISTQTAEQLAEMVLAWQPKGVNVNFSGCIDDTFRIIPNPAYASYINPKWLKTHGEPICFMPFADMLINCDGSVHFCCHNLKGKYPVGHVFLNGIYAGGLTRIWNNWFYQAVREHAVKGKFEKGEICFECRKR